jgi:hypothetical protein
MKIRKIVFFIALSLLPGLSVAALINQFHPLTDNSYYSYSEGDGSGNIITNKTTLTGFLLVTIDDVNFTVNIDYSNVLLNGSSLRSIDTLTTDITGISSAALVSGWDGEPNYISYGNATLSPFPFICVECGYELKLYLTANPLILSYHESNPYDTGAVDFELYVSQVPLPTSAGLFVSGLIALFGLGKRT